MTLIPKMIADLWVPGEVISENVSTLFSYLGKDLGQMELAFAIEMTQAWLREKGKMRWDMPKLMVDDQEAVLICAEALGMHAPAIIKTPEYNKGQPMQPKKHFDVGVVPGSTLRAMDWRLRGLNKNWVDLSILIMLCNKRPLNQLELEEMGKHRMVPVVAIEADAAQFILARAGGLDCHKMRAVITADDFVDGDIRRPARTDETVEALSACIDESDILVLLHQPYASRQVLTFERLLAENKFVGTATYVAAGPLPGPDTTVFEPDGNYFARLLDEAIRLLYELGQRELAVTA